MLIVCNVNGAMHEYRTSLLRAECHINTTTQLAVCARFQAPKSWQKSIIWIRPATTANTFHIRTFFANLVQITLLCSTHAADRVFMVYMGHGHGFSALACCLPALFTICVSSCVFKYCR